MIKNYMVIVENELTGKKQEIYFATLDEAETYAEHIWTCGEHTVRVLDYRTGEILSELEY